VSVEAWTMVAAVAAVTAAVVPLVRWIIDSVDVTVEVGARDEAGLFRQDRIHVHSGGKLKLEAVNLGGGTARNLTLRLSLPPEISVAEAPDNWRKGRPVKSMPDGSTAWLYDLPTIKGDTSESLPPLALVREADTYVPRSRQPIQTAQWGVWWKWGPFPKQGRGGRAFQLGVSVEPNEHRGRVFATRVSAPEIESRMHPRSRLNQEIGAGGDG